MGLLKFWAVLENFTAHPCSPAASLNRLQKEHGSPLHRHNPKGIQKRLNAGRPLCSQLHLKLVMRHNPQMSSSYAVPCECCPPQSCSIRSESTCKPMFSATGLEFKAASVRRSLFIPRAHCISHHNHDMPVPLPCCHTLRHGQQLHART